MDCSNSKYGCRNKSREKSKCICASDTVIPIYRLTNLVTNGNFANGATGWTSYNINVTSYSNGGPNNGPYALLKQPNATYARLIYNVTLINGNIYYFMRYVKKPVTAFNMPLYLTNGESYPGALAGYSAISSWTKNSQIYDTTGRTLTSYVLRHDMAGTNYESTDEISVSNTMMIDLTATFGADNEPTKEWCDTNLNYFDSSQNFYLSP